MADCIDILESIGQGCEKENQVGGVNRRVWVTQKSQVVSTTTDANGYVNTITMGVDNSSDSYKLITVTGKDYTHNGVIEGVIGDNTNTFNHSAAIKIFTATPAERAAVETLFKAKDLIVIFQNENDQIEVYGLDKGLKASAFAGGTGTALQDDTGMLLTLSGEQRYLPKYFLNGGSLATSIAYLDNISKAVV
jgi:hypothetical protein